MTFHQNGRLPEAERLYREILGLHPNHAQALHMLGILFLQKGAFEHSLWHFQRAIGIEPTVAMFHHNKGVALENLDRLDDAVTSYDRAITLQPSYTEAHFNRGNALGGLERWEDAVASYDQAIALEPAYADAHFNRGNMLRSLGRLAPAAVAYEHTLSQKPAFADAHFNLGEVLRAMGRAEDALASYDRAIALDPSRATAHFHRANLLSHLGRADEAVASYRAAVALEPNDPAMHNNLGVALTRLNRFEALASYDRAIFLDRNYSEALNNRGNILRELLRPQEALEDYDKAIALKPAYAEAYENKALVLVELGRLDTAAAALEESLRIAPERVRAYYSLAESRRFQPGDPHIAAMLAKAADMTSLTTLEQIHLNFALGKALADVGDTDAAFQRLLAGNALKRAEINYDELAVLGQLERIAAAFTSERIRKGGGGEPSEAPVFIVGMPRSGSTLVEQMLASHPQVFGAGEIVDLVQALAEFGDHPLAPLHDPAAATALTDAQLTQIGSSYVRRISDIAPQAKRITNKTLDNFRFLGLIHQALPNARIVHIRRDAIDTCLSCFSKLFAGDLPYAYDLRELGRYHRAYEAMMQHWRSVLPKGAMLEVRYEDLVADTEAHARRIVAFCGLAWDPVCLDFHRSERVVRTASVVQVRQPIFRNSLGRWRAYQANLGPLFEALEYDPSSPDGRR